MIPRLFPLALSGTVLVLGGCVVAPPPYAVAQQSCRQFTQMITVDGKSQPGYGLECLQADGSWQVVTPAAVSPPVQPQAAPYYGYVPYAYAPYYGGYSYYSGYPWYVGPQIGIGLGFGFGGGWHGGWGGHGGWGRHGGWRH